MAIYDCRYLYHSSNLGTSTQYQCQHKLSHYPLLMDNHFHDDNGKQTYKLGTTHQTLVLFNTNAVLLVTYSDFHFSFALELENKGEISFLVCIYVSILLSASNYKGHISGSSIYILATLPFSGFFAKDTRVLLII